MIRVPKNWRAIEQAGQVLYLQRLCGRYYVLPECGEWHAYFDIEGSAPFDGKPIGKHPNYEGALLLCREHLHAAEVSIQQQVQL